MNLLLKQQIAFWILLLFCAFPYATPAMSLAGGIIFSLGVGNPFPEGAYSWSKRLLQLAVVALGFGLPLSQIFQQAREAFPITIAGISITLLLGLALGRLLAVEQRTTLLVSFGTAICGGSAIAAMAPTIKAKNEEIAVSLATVFTLNALALILFPAIGRGLGLSQHDFGVWAGLAIHDTSSVVGAAGSYGAEALAVAVPVKLVRALWITPCVLVVGYLNRSDNRQAIPTFILGFLAAAMIRSVIPGAIPVWDMIAAIGRQMLVVTLFLVGCGLSRQTLAEVGWRPLLLGLSLWGIVSLLTLLTIGGRL